MASLRFYVTSTARSRWAVSGQGILTNADEEEQDEEDIEDREHRRRESRHDLFEGLDAAEDADDTEGAKDADHLAGAAGQDRWEEARDDDDCVGQAPDVGEEGPEPVAEEVDGELGRENYGEGEVHAVDEKAETGAVGALLRRRALVVQTVPIEILGLQHSAGEALKWLSASKPLPSQEGMLTAVIKSATMTWTAEDS